MLDLYFFIVIELINDAWSGWLMSIIQDDGVWAYTIQHIGDYCNPWAGTSGSWPASTNGGQRVLNTADVVTICLSIVSTCAYIYIYIYIDIDRYIDRYR